MTSIDIDPDSELVDYVLFSLKTRALQDIIIQWGLNTSLDFDLITEEKRVDIYLITLGVRQSVSDETAEKLSKIIDKHYRSLKSEDRFNCVIYSSQNNQYPEHWIRDVLEALALDIEIKHWIEDGKLIARLDNVHDFRDAFYRLNESIDNEVAKLWEQGFIKLNSSVVQNVDEYILRWDLVKSYQEAYVPDWVEPRISLNISRLLLDSAKSYPGKTRITVKTPKIRSLVTKHHLSKWCMEFLNEMILYTEDRFTIKIRDVEELFALVNFLFLDEPTMSGNIMTFKSLETSLETSLEVSNSNVYNETVYLTADGYIKSINTAFLD